jgi:hypothetical protein
MSLAHASGYEKGGETNDGTEPPFHYSLINSEEKP